MSIQKKLMVIIFCFSLFYESSIHAEAIGLDSLKFLLASAKMDTSRVLLLNRISMSYVNSKHDSAMWYAEEGLKLAREINFLKGEAYSLNALGKVFWITGNYPKSLEKLLVSLKILEKINDPQGLGNCIRDIGNVYFEQEDYRQALEYYSQAQRIIEPQDDVAGKIKLLLSFGAVYDRLDQLDSSLIFLQRAYEVNIQSGKEEGLSKILCNTGHLHLRMRHSGLALEYYRMGIPYSIANKQYTTLSDIYYGMTLLYERNGQSDSFVYYAKKSLDFAQLANYKTIILSVSLAILEKYEKEENADSAYKYLKIYTAAKDSLYNQRNMQEVVAMKFSEQIRQQEIAEQRNIEAKERKDNLQLMGIAVFIIIFFIVIIVLNRKTTKYKTVEIMAMIALLLFFEFISLLIHPFIAEMTHHTPIYMLGILGGIASGMVPAHHYLLEWVKKKIGQRPINISPKLKKRKSMRFRKDKSQ